MYVSRKAGLRRYYGVDLGFGFRCHLYFFTQTFLFSLPCAAFLIHLHFFFSKHSSKSDSLANLGRTMFQQNGTIASCTFPATENGFQHVSKWMLQGASKEEIKEKRMLESGDMGSSLGPSSILSAVNLWVSHLICLWLTSKTGNNTLTASGKERICVGWFRI